MKVTFLKPDDWRHTIYCPVWAGRGQLRRVKQFLRPASRPCPQVPFGLAQMKWNISTLTVTAQRTAVRWLRETGSTNGRVAFHSASTSRWLSDSSFDEKYSFHSLWAPHCVAQVRRLTSPRSFDWSEKLESLGTCNGPATPSGKGNEPGNEVYEYQTGSNGWLEVECNIGDAECCDYR